MRRAGASPRHGRLTVTRATGAAPAPPSVASGAPTLDVVHHCDAFTLLEALPPRSVDMLFIDPPYDVTELDFERPIDWQRFWRLARRILKQKASPVLSFSQQPFTTDLINSNREGYRYEIIIEKSMPTGFLDANRRPLRCHENLLIFADAMPDYWPVMDKATELRATAVAKTTSAHYNEHQPHTYIDNGTRYPRDVWHVAQRDSAFKNTKTLNPTQKPLQAIEKALAMYSQPGWLVVDCFAGSGTLAVGCRNLKRHFIVCDSDPAMVATMKERLRLPFEPHHVTPNNDLSGLPLFEAAV